MIDLETIETLENLEEAKEAMEQLNKLYISKFKKDTENKKYYDEIKKQSTILENLLLEFEERNYKEDENFKLKFENGYIERKKVFELKYDDDLIEFLENNNYNNYINIIKSVKKVEFKKEFKISEAGAFSEEDGFLTDKARLQEVEKVEIKFPKIK